MRKDDRLFLDTASRAMQSALGIYTGAVYDEEDETEEDAMREDGTDGQGYNDMSVLQGRKRAETDAERRQNGQ